MADFRPFSPCWGDISFTEAPRTTARCYAGAIFLSRSPFGATARARGVAWPRCPRVAGPGQTTRRRTKPHASTPGPTGMEGAGGTGGPGCGARGRRRGQAKLRADAPIQMLAGGPPPTSTPGAAGVKGAGGICLGAGGRWRGLAGLRGDAPSEARGADSSRAAGPTGTHSGRAHRRPEHQRSHKQQHTARTARGRPGPPAPRTPAAQHAT